MLTVLVLLAGAAFSFGLVRAVASEIPLLDPAAQHSEVDGVVYAADGHSVLAVLRGQESRVLVKNIDDVSPIMRQAIVSVEDRRFYEHNGVDTRGVFTQRYGTDALDAANLIMPLVFFISPTDPRMIGTINRTMAELVSDSLVYRYEMGRGAGDGLTGGEDTGGLLLNAVTGGLGGVVTAGTQLGSKPVDTIYFDSNYKAMQLSRFWSLLQLQATKAFIWKHHISIIPHILLQIKSNNAPINLPLLQTKLQVGKADLHIFKYKNKKLLREVEI